MQHAEHHREGQQVEQRAERPEEEHEPADKREVPVRRSAQLFLVDLVGGDGELARVVEQVVEQDLDGSIGRKVRKRRASGAEHVAEVARGAHEDVLDGVGEDPPSLGDTVGEDAEVLLEQDDVGRVLGDVGAASTEIPTSAACSASASLTPSPRNATPRPRRALDADDARLVLGADPREDVGGGRRPASASSSTVDIGARSGRVRVDRQAEVPAHLAATAGVVAGDDLDRDAETGAAVAARRRRRASAGRGRRGDPTSRGGSSSAVTGAGRRRRPRGHRDDAAAGVELALPARSAQPRARPRRSGPGRPPGRPWSRGSRRRRRPAQRRRPSPASWSNGSTPAGRTAPASGERRPARRGRPQRQVERVAADRAAAVAELDLGAEQTPAQHLLGGDPGRPPGRLDELDAALR